MSLSILIMLLFCFCNLFSPTECMFPGHRQGDSKDVFSQDIVGHINGSV